MVFSIFIRKTFGKGWIVGIVIYFGSSPFIFAQSLENDSQNKHMVSKQNYRSAMTGQLKSVSNYQLMQLSDSRDNISGKRYTIQLFTTFEAIKDPVLENNPKIRRIRMGDVYRYTFSQYDSPGKAREALIFIRQLYPDACIREYYNGKLGLIIDMNINN